jgi:hypothetical protein
MNVKLQREFIPVSPQPDDNMLILIHRNYQILKASPTGSEQFKKRITWLEKGPGILPEISGAIVEYIGTFPGRLYHGLAKDESKNVKYFRTKQKVHDMLQNQLENRSAKDVERENNKKINDDFDKQRNEKQLRNIKYNLTGNNQNGRSGIIADQIVKIEELGKTHPFVKSVNLLGGSAFPLIVLYTQQQIHDIKRFACKENGSILGVDKTYNLGKYFN